ncbi:MAG: hypothetical protein UZ19_OD1000117 [Parcubacteria bacterium OLB19]|nr:MAG: hypothetical protein UZ19_OD1000117 [Parcubacteria bacterium OLB19]
MLRTQNSFSLLQATAAVCTFAIILWSLGVPTIRFAEAANVKSFSDTLSDSAPSTVSNHTITFVTPTGLAAGETISLEFETGFTGIASLTAEDLDLSVNGSDQSLIDGAASGANWNVTAAGQVIDITSGTSTIGTNATVTIEIGTNATFATSGDSQITNPAVGSYWITVDVGNSDSGQSMVAIVNTVTVTASVDTIFNFTVNGVNNGLSVNGASTTGTSTSTAIPFGQLVADTPATLAQDLSVSTNAANGFVVTVQTDQQLSSTNGSDIDGFIDGAYTSSPTQWVAPSQTLGQENTYGHWGITSNDDTVTSGLTDEFDVSGNGEDYVSASTTPVEIFRHNGPTNGTLDGVGIARVGYTVETSGLQEAATDYTATLTYVATPVF